MRSDERELKDLPQIEARAGYITPVKQTPGGMSAAMLAVTIACAIGAGALLTTGGQGGLGLSSLSDTFTSVMRAAGWRSPANMEFEETTTLAEIQRDIGSVATNIDALSTRIDIATRTTDREFARLKSEIGTIKTALAPTTRDKIADRGSTAIPRTAKLDPTRTGDVETLTKRVEKLEVAVASGQDVTGSIPATAAAAAPAEPELVAVPPAKQPGRRSARLGKGFTATEVAGSIMIRGPRGGVYTAEVGAFVPGLGRIDGLRQRGRLVVIGDKERGLFDRDAEAAPKRR